MAGSSIAVKAMAPAVAALPAATMAGCLWRACAAFTTAMAATRMTILPSSTMRRPEARRRCWRACFCSSRRCLDSVSAASSRVARSLRLSGPSRCSALLLLIPRRGPLGAHVSVDLPDARCRWARIHRPVLLVPESFGRSNMWHLQQSSEEPPGWCDPFVTLFPRRGQAGATVSQGGHGGSGSHATLRFLSRTTARRACRTRLHDDPPAVALRASLPLATHDGPL